MSRLTRVLGIGALFLGLAGVGVAYGASPRVFQIEDGAEPLELIVRVAYASIQIVGAERDDVAMWVELAPREGSDLSDPGLSATTTLLVPEIEGRSMRIERPKNQDPLVLRLEVPRDLVLRIWGSNGGRVIVRDVHGPMWIENSNNGVTMENVAGTAVVFTSNGSILADFTSVIRDAPMSFVTSNGKIDLTLPADLTADVLLETDNAEFLSDFTIQPKAAPREWPLPPNRRRVSGTINGGGSLIRLQTENAGIRLRAAARTE